MNKKLTLNVDESLIDFAKAYSKESNQSISNIFEKYLPIIAEFSMKLSDNKKPPEITPLMKAVGASIPDVERKIKEVTKIAGEDS